MVELVEDVEVELVDEEVVDEEVLLVVVTVVDEPVVVVDEVEVDVVEEEVEVDVDVTFCKLICHGISGECQRENAQNQNPYYPLKRRLLPFGLQFS